MRLFGHNRHGLKIVEGLYPLFCGGGGAGSPSNTMWPGPMPTFIPTVPTGILIHPAVWSQQTWGKNNRHGPKIGGCALWGRSSWVPIWYNVARAEAYLHAKFHLDPFNLLATVHQRYRETGQADRQWSDGIGWTVFVQTVRPIHLRCHHSKVVNLEFYAGHLH